MTAARSTGTNSSPQPKTAPTPSVMIEAVRATAAPTVSAVLVEPGALENHPASTTATYRSCRALETALPNGLPVSRPVPALIAPFGNSAS